MTNRSFLATGDQKYLIRFSGEGTGNIINRKQEADVYHQLAGKDISDEVLYIIQTTVLRFQNIWKSRMFATWRMRKM